MAQAARLNLRMQKELKLLLTDPPPGASFPFVSADSDLASLLTIDAQIEGPEGTVYAKGIFNVKIQIPERYPFQPPSVTFATPIYHPNIDNGGRICLDILNLPPKGAWQPSLNISTVLTSIGLLMSEPNPDDGLMCEVSKEYKYNRQAFEQKARAMTEKYARTGANGHNFRTQCIHINSDLSKVVEDKQSDKELRHEFCDFVFRHSKPCGTSRKLSLEPSRSTHKRSSDDEPNGLLEPLPFDLENMEAKENRKESRESADKYNLRHKKLCRSERKSSPEAAVSFHKIDGCDVKNGDPKHTHSFCNAQSLSRGLSESSLLQCGSSHELQLHQHHGGKSTYDSKIMSSNRLYHVSQKIPSGSLDACKASDCSNKKVLVTSAISSCQSHSNSSGACTMPSTVNHNVLQTCQDSVDKMEISSTDTKRKKVFLVSKKLSLGFKGSSERQEKDDKENDLLIRKLSFSIPKTQREVGIGRKLSLGPLTQLQGRNEKNNQLHSGYPSTDESQRQQSDQYQNSKLDGEVKQYGEELQVAESIIVLDSEDSEEENNGSVRPKRSLVRKHIGKRKTQA